MPYPSSSLYPSSSVYPGEVLGTTGVTPPNLYRIDADAGPPSGVDGFIEFGGLILNDRRLADCYWITDVDGIDDADVVDAREKRAQQHGEDPLDSEYSG